MQDGSIESREVRKGMKQPQSARALSLSTSLSHAFAAKSPSLSDDSRPHGPATHPMHIEVTNTLAPDLLACGKAVAI